MNCPRKIAESCEAVYCSRYPDLPPYRGNEKTVFINGDKVYDFVKLIQSDIELAIVHNSDNTFGQYEASLLLPYVDTIHAVNADCDNVTQIPIGFSDHAYRWIIETGYNPKPKPKDIEIYLNYFLPHHPERHRATDYFKGRATDHTHTSHYHKLDYEVYFDYLCRSKYVICPEGTGMDTQRIYEALWCGAIPVVKSSPLDEMHKSLGVKIVNDWSEI